MTNNVGLTFSVGDTTPRFTNSLLSKTIRIGDTIFSVVGTYEPYPSDSIYIWASLSLFPLEYDGRATYKKVHPYSCKGRPHINFMGHV
jgi:hypothetical protein